MTEAAAPAAAAVAPGTSVPSATPAAAPRSAAPARSAAARESAKAANRAAALAALGKGPEAAKAEPAAASETPAAEVVAPATEAAPDPHAAARKAAEERYLARAKEQRAKIAQKQAETAEKAKRDAEEQSWRQKLDASKADLERAELAKKDPFAYLESLGVTATQLVERGIKRGSPEAAAEARIAAAEQKASELAQWKEDFLKQQTEAQQKAKVDAQHAAIIKEKQDLLSVVLATPQEYPNISGWPDDYLADRAFRAGKEYWDAYQEVPIRAHVLKALDSEEAARKAARNQGSTAGAASVTSGATAPTQAKASGAPKTLTGSHGKSSQSARPNSRASMAEKKAAAVAAMSRASR